MPDDDMRDDAPETIGPRSLWSGSITFGLLSLHVDMYPAVRSEALPLKMVDDQRRLLTRRYFCPEHGKPLARDEIVRGYETESGEYLIVEDDELDALAPEKSRAIDLRRFVELKDIDPMYFKRSYFLTPADEEASRAYRLLAETMERSGRAGVATFVMRGKEYLVALVAEDGLLRAETLRFKDELREPEQAGLPITAAADQPLVKRFRKAIDALAEEQVDRAELVDERTLKLRRIIDDKLEKGVDVERIEVDEEAQEEAEIIDLMEVLKRRLQPLATGEPRDTAAEAGRAVNSDRGKGSKRADGARNGSASLRNGRGNGKGNDKGGGERAARSRADDDAARAARGSGEGGDVRDGLEDESRDALYERAKAMGVPGRSRMDKAALVKALRRASGD